MNKKQKRILLRILLSSGLLAILSILPLPEKLRPFLFLIPFIIIGYDILIRAAKGIKNKQPFDENLLMAAATVSAVLLGQYIESSAVMLFYQIGELFQSIAVGKSRRNIAELMDIRPDYANIEDKNGELIQVDPEEVLTGMVITVRPGERIPIDGIIENGSSSLDAASLTGESIPITATVGSAVYAGCINLTGLLRIRTTRKFSESTVSRILELVEHASSRKSRSENFISHFARVYTPAVCGGALLLFLLPPVLLLILSRDPNWTVWLYRALTFLVISCPCAVVISVPLTFFAGMGGAGHAGILIKGSNFLEALSRVKYLAFDKTGTLTQGVFEVSNLYTSGDKNELLRLAAHAECFSNHPIARSIRDACKEPIDPTRVTNAREITGYGVLCLFSGHEVAVGNDQLMKELGVFLPELHIPGTLVHLSHDRKYMGTLQISDRLKPHSAEAIRHLKRLGIRKTIMLTGDTENVAEEFAAQAGIDRVYAELLPQDKVRHVEKLLSRCKKGEKLAFAGDGINDAPVLIRADIGIAMGALGSDAAIEAADVVLMDDNPAKIAKAISISHRCMRIVYENISFSIGIKLLCLILAALGKAGMWSGIFADVGVMILAVLNAMRALTQPKQE